MRQLNWDLRQLQLAHPEGSYATRTARSFALAQAADMLHELGFRRLRATGLKGKHVEALVREWQGRGLSPGTMKNRMANLRWWAGHVGKPQVVRPDNASYGIPDRAHVTNEDRSRILPADRLARIADAHVAMSLRLQASFGLRREEAIKFTPLHADRGDWVFLRASTTKGGRARRIPVRNAAQRELLDAARRLAGGGALIPPHRNYKQQRKAYERETTAAGLERMHGLRHAYAQTRYEELTGWKPPALGGPARKALRGRARRADTTARLTVARELGHGRMEVVGVYCGT